MLDVRRALEFLTEDPKVVEKAGLGAVILIAPVLSLACFGYEVEVAQRVAAGQARPLPDWNELGQLWRKGAWLGLAYVVYSLPIMGLMLFGLFGGAVWIALLAQNDSSQSRANLLGAGLVVFILALAVVAILYGLLLSVFRPALVAEYARRGTFGACFNIAGMWRFIRRQPSQYALLWGAELVVGWVVSLPMILVFFLVSFIPFFGQIIGLAVVALVSFMLLLFNGHMVGQLMQAAPQSVVSGA